ncbi:MAG TPA: hypothetical protein VGP80_03455 [Gemmatimonadales bacterium]|jgi:hypothetical protein|nr:hypothetical protein [Gemmatimonadales bacterium]
MSENLFGSERDRKLGDLLRQYLEPSDHPGFVRRVMVGLHATDNSWDVLSRWARPGIAAALAFILGAATWVILQTAAEPQSLSDAMLPGDAPAPLFSATRPDNELVLEVVLER